MRRFIAALALVLPVTAGTLYSVRAVGPENSVATAIGQDGSVSGYSTDAYGQRTAFAFDGAISLLAPDASAYDTSGAGVSAGVVWTGAGARAAVWDNGATRLLDLMDSYALALNKGGAVAGSAMHGDRTSAFVQSGATVTWIDAGVWSAAYDLNDSGQLAGTLETSGGRFRAFTWSAAGGLRELGTLGGPQSWAQAINDAGVVVGSSTTRTGYQHAFVHRDGRMNDLGTLGGFASGAYDVNADGVVVGYSYDAFGRSLAFLWRDGMLFDLNELIDPAAGWTLEAAYGINQRGQIVGTGRSNGIQTAFLLDPLTLTQRLQLVQYHLEDLSAVSSAVPEAGNLVAFLLAGAMMLAIRRVRV